MPRKRPRIVRRKRRRKSRPITAAERRRAQRDQQLLLRIWRRNMFRKSVRVYERWQAERQREDPKFKYDSSWPQEALRWLTR